MRFLPVILCLLLCGCSIPKASDQPLSLVIMHTNDVHSYLAGQNEKGKPVLDNLESSVRGGYPRLKELLITEELSPDLLLDAGDQFQGTLYFSLFKEKPIAELMNAVGYMAMVPGNHEFDDSCERLAQFSDLAQFPLLAANMESRSSDCALKGKYKPWIIREVKGVPVGIIGLVRSDMPGMSSPCAHMRFTDEKAALEKSVKELERRGIDVIIALTHIGYDKDLKLAQEVDGVDIFVGGHSHTLLNNSANAAQTEGKYPAVEHSPDGTAVLVVTSGYAGNFIGSLAVQFDEKGVLKAWDGDTLPLNGKQDEQTLKFLQAYVDKMATVRQEKVGAYTAEYDKSYPLDNEPALCRVQECYAGMVLADAFLEYGKNFGADAAVINGGSVRIPLVPGEINRGDVLMMQPFNNKMIPVKLTGSDVEKMLEHGASGMEKQEGCFLQVSGIKYSLDPSKPVGSRVSDVSINNVPLDLTSTYNVIANEFIQQGGDGFDMLKSATVLPSSQSYDSDILTGYFLNHTVISKPQGGRIIIK